MKTHKMNLQDKYFNFITNGTKRIELRLYDEKKTKNPTWGYDRVQQLKK